MVATVRRPKSVRVASGVYAAYTVLMLEVDRRMRRTGGPGIIAFELAGEADRANDIMTLWGVRGRRLARASLWLDFGYMVSYSALAALLVDRTLRRRGHPRALTTFVAGALGGDAIEGIALLRVLKGRGIATDVRRARVAALTKFALLAVCLVYVVAGNAMPVTKPGRDLHSV